MKYVKQQLDINKTVKDHATNRYKNKSGRHWSNLSKPYQTHSPFYRSLRRRLGKENADLTDVNLSNEIKKAFAQMRRDPAAPKQQTLF